MCGIAGLYHSHINFDDKPFLYKELLEKMIVALKHRGPDDNGIYLSQHFGLAHTRLSIIDLNSGHQPMLFQVANKNYGIVYNGELYNMNELKIDLLEKGYIFQTSCDTEIILLGFVEYGSDFVKKLNGIFAFSIMDELENSLYLFRDRSGIKPLFYHILSNGTVIFSSEMKGLFAHPDIKPQLDHNGLNEIFSIGPAKTPGCGVFQSIEEVLPGHFLKINASGIKSIPYWKLESHPHLDTYQQTLEKTRYLVTDSIQRQMISDVPICTFLSGGVDSSIVSAVCANQLKKQNKQLNTFSFDFVANDKYFKANNFQPSQDRPYVDIMVNEIQSNHRFLECSIDHQFDFLYQSVLSHDLPCMADIDSSMLYFCSIVKDYNKVVLTGECADEIFGGYPWFHKQEFFIQDSFPWTPNLAPRSSLLSDDFIESLKMEDYVRNAYHTSLSEVPTLASDNPTEKKRREISYLNLRWFMQTLLDRTDRTSMFCGLEARVPFADHRIIEYLFNVPWEMKAKDGVVKNLLRNSCKGLLPDEILFRRKSPYPKTYDPHYEKLLSEKLIEVIETPSSPIRAFIDKKKVYQFLASTSDYGSPWYGQLMAGPQLLAYLLQINFWMEYYKISLI
ncbi:MAG TPA: asparagine synthase (glutamine-hydrolyzing) [Lachnospiraceae bacterium]|nr:asparagine synthase (glutamine-hydrolyzing) [Lachnospiraceae bacterium]